MHTRRTFRGALAALLLLAAPLAAGAQTPPPTGTPQFPLATGRFQPSWDSLTQYKAPAWFRDAKFGIWAHWSAQCVPEQGDWYARQMYQEGNPDYKFHQATYGPQSRVGFKDIDHMWHAEHWNPERLMDLYVRAGAHYFVALANHHDNFDTWNSKYQPWNSVNIGPHKDIVGTWAKIARKRGLHFGVTVHAARTWDWFDVSHGADTEGPYQGIPYDGNLTKADGKGQWWDGYDPAELYGPAGAARTPEAHAAYEAKFYNRVMDLLNSYHPDLLYFDDGEPPTAYGLDIASNFYNESPQWNHGQMDAVLNVKSGSPRVKESMVLDYERGRSNAILPNPWQTDTCIGDWHYRRSIYENHQYKTPDQVVKMLVDIVSKNGNLLLNIPVRGDGTIDDDEIQFLQGMAAWMGVNKEAIFGTRPWKISGEGPVKVRGGGFSEGGEARFTGEDFRFTTKANTLYATALGWPDSGKYVVRTLAVTAPGIQGKIQSVALLGYKGKLPWTRTAAGLEVMLPAKRPCDHAWVLKIQGLDLAASTPVAPIVPGPTVHAGQDGVLILSAVLSETQGDQIQVETHGAVTNLGYWDNAADSAAWTVDVPKAGTYRMAARIASPSDAVPFVVEAAGQTVAGSAPNTGGFETYQTVPLGTVSFTQAGPQKVTVHPRDAASWHAINLAEITLTSVP